MRYHACPGSIPGRDKFPGWSFRGFSSPLRQMSGNVRPIRSRISFGGRLFGHLCFRASECQTGQKRMISKTNYRRMYLPFCLFIISTRRTRPVMPKVSGGEVGGVPSFHFLKTNSTLPLSEALLRSTLYCSGGFLMCFVRQPPSNSLSLAVTDYTTLLFCFDSTCHSYYGTLRRRKVGGRGI